LEQWLGQPIEPDPTAMFAIGGLVPEGGLAGAADRKFYSVAAEVRLRPGSYPGLSRAAHFQEANEWLLTQTDLMEVMGIRFERAPSGLAPSSTSGGMDIMQKNPA
jgi:hypothetical protein